MSVGSNGSENYAEDLWDYLESSQPASGAAGNPLDYPINSSIEFQRTDGSQWTPGIVRGYWFNGVIVDDSLAGTRYMARWSEIRSRRVFKPKIRSKTPIKRGKSASGGSRRQRRRRSRRHSSRNRRRQRRRHSCRKTKFGGLNRV
jgi:hypothetical protein